MQRVDESNGWKPAESLDQTAARDPNEAEEKQLKVFPAAPFETRVI